jgi:hypothetical protein
MRRIPLVPYVSVLFRGKNASPGIETYEVSGAAKRNAPARTLPSTSSFSCGRSLSMPTRPPFAVTMYSVPLKSISTGKVRVAAVPAILVGSIAAAAATSALVIVPSASSAEVTPLAAIDSVALPLAAPPARPVPAVTPVMSPSPTSSTSQVTVPFDAIARIDCPAGRSAHDAWKSFSSKPFSEPASVACTADSHTCACSA